ncbi:MAG: carboxypeptidase M32 [Oscillospiraceae bacterium]|nr:carboxypeptidase M32 [Oscillospiraceae bacterium]
MEKLLKLKNILEEVRMINISIGQLSWDQSTEQPKLARGEYSNVLAYLYGKSHSLIINDEVRDIINSLKDDDSLNNIDRAILNELKDDFEKKEKIPKEQYEEYARLQSLSTLAWEEAKEKDDFEIFKPFLEKIVDYDKKFIELIGINGHPYNTLLRDYEKGLNVDDLDKFFHTLKEELMPLVLKASSVGNPVFDFEHKAYDIDKQRKFSRFLSEYLGLDFQKAVLKESAHPFTDAFSNKDTRITSHYHLNKFLSSIFSTAHETGHALYEQGIDDEIAHTILGSGSSMAMHESQSRLYENIIVRNKNFWVPIYDKLQAIYYDNLKDVSLDDFYRCINKSQPSLIRIEADELTYPFHIIIRYEIEKLLFEDKVKVSDLPEIWNEKVYEYLGIKPTGFSDGILQDIHYSKGNFGYFPSYALGSAYASQFAYGMSKTLNLDECLLQGNLLKINEYLRRNMHKYGKLKTSKELLLEISGEEFNPKYYTEYLKDKFSSIYK